MALLTYIGAITQALEEEMRRDERVFILGEDVGIEGGVFKATKGLYQEFGPERVMDTPLAEGIIISAAIGAAMAGLRPVPEIQFVDFITPAMDALTQQAAKLRYRSGGTQTCPFTLRFAMEEGWGEASITRRPTPRGSRTKPVLWWLRRAPWPTPRECSRQLYARTIR